MDNVIREENKQKQIVNLVTNMEYPYKHILFEVYIQGKSLVKVASDMDYDYKHMCYTPGIALKKFDELDK